MNHQVFCNISKIIERDSKSTTYKFALLRGGLLRLAREGIASLRSIGDCFAALAMTSWRLLRFARNDGFALLAMTSWRLIRFARNDGLLAMTGYDGDFIKF